MALGNSAQYVKYVRKVVTYKEGVAIFSRRVIIFFIEESLIYV